MHGHSRIVYLSTIDSLSTMSANSTSDVHSNQQQKKRMVCNSMYTIHGKNYTVKERDQIFYSRMFNNSNCKLKSRTLLDNKSIAELIQL